MIIIDAVTTNDAWRKTFRELYLHEGLADNNKYYKDSLAIIHITSPGLEVKDTLFPMSQNDIDVINKYVVTGDNEDKVNHEWTKLYYHRMFDEPHSQIEFMIHKLQESLPVGEALISMWKKEVDQMAKISPCTEIVWGRVKVINLIYMFMLILRMRTKNFL